MEPNLRFFDTMGPNFKESGHIIQQRLQALPEDEKRTRKFIVIKNDKKLFVIIGPELVNDQNHQSFYFHKDLRQVALFLLDKDGSKKYAISGGGLITFRHASYKDGWYADFGGYSSDYGAYDPVILAYRSKIAMWLNMTVDFQWSGSCRRSKDKK